jgi:uncharacterized protein YjbI with pentapeptide repeats
MVRDFYRKNFERKHIINIKSINNVHISNRFEIFKGKRMKINEPKITSLREAGPLINQIIELQALEQSAEGLKFSSDYLSGEDLSGIDYNCVEFDNCKLIGCDFSKAGFTNVYFKHCDISNCIFDSCYFNQVEFISCKGVGSKFQNSTIKHVLINDGNFTYANFEHSKFQKVLITTTNFSNAALAECILKEIELQKVIFNHCDFFKTPLKGIDFRDSDIDGIVLSDNYKELVGAIVDTYQAAALARFLGVEVK